MPEHRDACIGKRLRDVRKRRGMTQKELARAAGVSVSLVSKLEQGELQDTRMETARRLAVAMRVPTSSLLQRDADTPDTSDPWRPLQQAVEVAASGDTTEEPALDGTAAILPEVRTRYFGNRMAELSTLLVPLLRDADALGDDRDARSLRAHLLQIAGSVLTQARQFSAATTALQRALDSSTNRHRAASIITTWTWLLTRQGRLAEARELAVRWADDLEPRVSRATPEDLAAWGWLLLQASAASLRDNREGEARDTMRLARSAAVMTGRELPRGDSSLTTWGPVTVAYKRAERGIVLDRPDEVLDVAGSLSASGPGASTEYHRHRLDVAKAHVMLRQYGEAVTVLNGVRQQAPEWLSHQRYARDIVGEVIGRRRTLTEEMRQLADAVQVPL